MRAPNRRFGPQEGRHEGVGVRKNGTGRGSCHLGLPDPRASGARPGKRAIFYLGCCLAAHHVGSKSLDSSVCGQVSLPDGSGSAVGATTAGIDILLRLMNRRDGTGTRCGGRLAGVSRPSPTPLRSACASCFSHLHAGRQKPASAHSRWAVVVILLMERVRTLLGRAQHTGLVEIEVKEQVPDAVFEIAITPYFAFH